MTALPDLVAWSRQFEVNAKPWLVLGKGPSFGKIHGVDTSAYHLLSLNHVVRDRPVAVAHAIDLDVAIDCADAMLANAGILLMPLHPHVRFKPSERDLESLADEVPVLREMARRQRLVWYNASTWKRPREGSPVVDVKFFSAEAAIAALATIGAKAVRSLGVDGGDRYASEFQDLNDVTLLANGRSSFDRQFEGIARTLQSHDMFYAPLTVKAPVRVFVGADSAQMLGVKLLEYSIKKHASLSVSVEPIDDAGIPVPKDPANRSRTGFSFSRFRIPELCGYRGRGIYMDADMQVFTDILDLWSQPFGEASVLYCREPAGSTRPPQFSVLLLDCGNLDWNVRSIVGGFDTGDYAYADLMQRMCILPEARRKAALPPEWNSLEHYEPGRTKLIHYTDMPTQPWVSKANKNGALFYAACREAVAGGFISRDFVYEEVAKGHVAPDFPAWIGLEPMSGVARLREAWQPPFRRFVGLAGQPAKGAS